MDTTPSSSKGRRRIWRWILVSILVLVLIVSAALAWLLFPPKRELHPTDAVLVMANMSDGRHEMGASLIDEGIAPNLIVSNPLGEKDIVGHSYCAGENIPEAAAEAWCMDPFPVSTTGEAWTFEELAREQAWSTVTVVTARTHARRVQQNFDHCTDLDANVVWIDVVEEDILQYIVAHEFGGLLQLWLTDHC